MATQHITAAHEYRAQSAKHRARHTLLCVVHNSAPTSVQRHEQQQHAKGVAQQLTTAAYHTACEAHCLLNRWLVAAELLPLNDDAQQRTASKHTASKHPLLTTPRLQSGALPLLVGFEQQHGAACVAQQLEDIVTDVAPDTGLHRHDVDLEGGRPIWVCVGGLGQQARHRRVVLVTGLGGAWL